MPEQEQDTDKAKRSYRHFSAEDKLQLLAEAEESSVYGTAIRHQLAPSQLFQWRKKLRMQEMANSISN